MKGAVRMFASADVPVPRASVWLMRRLDAAAAVTFVGLVVHALMPLARAADPPKDFDEEVALKYARVAGWQGFWESTETRSFSKSGAGGFTNKSYEAVSHGRFELTRDRNGSDPEHGDFEWSGTGEASGTTSESVSSWSKSGSRMTGEEYQISGGGHGSSRDVHFTLWLGRQFASLHAGTGTEDVAPMHKVGRAVTQLSSSDGQHHYKEVTIDESWSAPIMQFFIPNYEGETKNWLVAQGGPGVLVFEREDHHHVSIGGLRRSRVVMAPVYDDLDVEVTLANYENWLPRGNIAAPKQPGSKVEVRATLITKGAAATRSPPAVREFQFKLEAVSREPGICMNWPRFGPDGDAPPATDPKPDLRFGPSGGATLGAEELSATIVPALDARRRATAVAQIDSYDFGGHATLRVVCVLEDGREILGILKQQGADYAMIPVPWRRKGSRIANAWADRVGLSGRDGEDLDARPVGDGNKGDGFSNYEEYRGFVQLADHLRTRPERKDLFIRNRLGPRALPGIFRYADITDVAVHYELRPAEMPVSRRMNPNRSAESPRTCASDQFQHGLILDKIIGGDASITDITGDLWRPEYVASVRILWELFDRGNEEQLASTIAHEVLHATGVRHHGEMDDYVVWLQKSREINGSLEHWFEERSARFDEGIKQFVFPSTPGTRIRIFIDANNEVAADVGVLLPQPQIMFLGHYWQQHSGDVNCVMRYHCAQAFVIPGRTRDRFLSPGEPFAKGICSSPAGTDFNAPQPPGQRFSRYSSASRGDCIHRVCVRDDAPDKAATP